MACMTYKTYTLPSGAFGRICLFVSIWRADLGPSVRKAKGRMWRWP